MIELNPEKGAPFISKIAHGKTLQSLMREIIEENPNLSDHEIIDLFSNRVREDTEYLELCIKYCAVNHCATIRKSQYKTEKFHHSQLLQTIEKAEAKKKVDEVVETIKHFNVMNFIMPNGKPLRECTFADVAQAGARFSSIARLGEPRQIVGQVLSEKQVQLVWEYDV